MDLVHAAPPSVLAFITTLHLALVVLRAHRGPRGRGASVVVGVSFAFASAPWLLASPTGLAAGFVAHLAWFVACERLLPAAPSPAAARAVPAAPRQGPPTAGIVETARRPPAKAPTGFVQATVMAVFDETPDIRTFRIARPEGFEFMPGQFLTVRLRGDGKEHVRCYSISSPPGARGYLEITVKRLGLVSGALHATVRPGSTLAIRPPAGKFVYPANEDRPIVLIAGGVGITPLMCMLRHALDSEPMRPCTLFYSVRKAEDIAFRDEIALLERRFVHFRAFIAVTDGAAGGGCFPGRITAALVTAMAPDIAHATCLMCGPQPMLEAMTDLLISIGVPRGQISFEIFQAAVAASTAPVGTTASAPCPEPAADSAHEARFERSRVAARVQGNQTLLDAAEGCGAAIPSLCRAGVCGTCRTRVLRGDVRCDSSVLDDQDRQDGFVLACATRVHSDCAVDA